MLKNLTIVFLVSSFVFSCKSGIKLKNNEEFRNVEVDTTLLFGIWGIDEGGDAAFKITNQDFYVVDFFETSSYKLEKNKLIIDNSEYYRDGIIIEVTKDTIKIKWNTADDVGNYWRFKN